MFLTIVNYIMYNRAIKRGTIIWGKIDFASQFVLIFPWKMFPPPEWQSLIFLAAIVFVPMALGRVPGLKNFTVSAFTMIKIGFLMIVVADAIWMTPHGFVATQGLATHPTNSVIMMRRFVLT